LALRLQALTPSREGGQGGGWLECRDEDAGQPAGAGPIWPGRPLECRGVWLRLLGAGPLVTVRAAGPDGAALGLQSFPAGAADEVEAALPFSAQQTEQTFAVPAARLSARLVLLSGPDAAPRYRLEVYEGREPRPSLQVELEESGIVELQGVTLQLYLGSHAWISAHRHSAGDALVAVGLLLACLGGAQAGRRRGAALLASTDAATQTLQAPAGDPGWEQPVLDAFARQPGAGARALAPLVALVGGLALTGMLGARGLLPWGFMTGALLAAGWLGLAAWPLASEWRGATAHWGEALAAAGWRWLSIGLTLQAVERWLRHGQFWSAEPAALLPAALWLAAGAGCGVWLVAGKRPRWRRWARLGVGAAAWLLAVTAAMTLVG
ncbi:MAG: hypothetical protein GX605_05900, partial [Chloroflexi bacterium]|nr:hypothetical protein [Chloroflexota bacterium]